MSEVFYTGYYCVIYFRAGWAILSHNKNEFFVFWMTSQSNATRCPRCLIVCVCVLSRSQRGLKGDHWCQRVLSRKCEMYTKQKPQSFRDREDKADFCSGCSIFIFWLLAEELLFVHPQNTAQATFSFVLMNLGM